MPDGLIGEKDGLFHDHLFLPFHAVFDGGDVVLADHKEK